MLSVTVLLLLLFFSVRTDEKSAKLVCRHEYCLLYGHVFVGERGGGGINDDEGSVTRIFNKLICRIGFLSSVRLSPKTITDAPVSSWKVDVSPSIRISANQQFALSTKLMYPRNS